MDMYRTVADTKSPLLACSSEFSESGSRYLSAVTCSLTAQREAGALARGPHRGVPPNSSLPRPSYRVKGYLTATARRSEMWVDTGAEVRARMGELVGDAERQRLVAQARAGRAGGPRTLAGYVQQVRQAAGFGLVRTGLRLLDAGRV
jgi:hypothetical protein